MNLIDDNVAETCELLGLCKKPGEDITYCGKLQLAISCHGFSGDPVANVFANSFSTFCCHTLCNLNCCYSSGLGH
eukprot:Skav207252  [mRNA]  locus=scaffold2560:29726:29950:- [translate_table: standard]